MTYSKLYFGKEINELNYDDIENFFIEEKEESNKIEFKSYYNPDEKNHTEKENGVVRAICGLLNSEGGIVIWGSPIGEKVEGKKEKIFKGELSPSDKLIEKDSFISRTTDLLTPAPIGINFQCLEKNGKYIYIIDVKQSIYSPHQFRNTYYMRIDGQTKPAPHHFIEALFHKISFPKLEGYLKIESVNQNGSEYILELTSMIFNKSKLQNEHNIYYRILILPGKFSYYQNDLRKDRIYYNPGDMAVQSATPTLYCNQPIRNTETIIIRPVDLTKHNFEITAMLYFGGEKSPLMISEYKISLQNPYLSDTNLFFTSMNENQYLYEKSDKIDKTEEEKMKIILGR